MTSSATHRGFMALISVLVISFILTSFALLAGENGLRARMNTTAIEDRLVAAHRARSCASIALLRMAQDSSYSQGPDKETVLLASDQVCEIEEVFGSDERKVIRASGQAGASIARVYLEAAIASTSAITLLTWSEM